MADEAPERDDAIIVGFPRLQIPIADTPTEEQLARRRRQIAAARQLRDRIGPIGIATDDLVHESRESEAT